MVDFRFYLFSVIAVFLALGTGMLLGGALSGGGALAEKQRAMVADLEGQYREMRERERVLAERLAELERKARRDDAFAASAVPVLVAGRLEGRSLVVVTSHPEGTAREVARVCGSAGASPVAVVPLPPEDGAAGLVAQAAAAVGGRPDGVVLLVQEGDAEQQLEPLLREALQEWSRQGVAVAAGAPADAAPSFGPLFRRLRVPFVSNADEPGGQVGLVSLLAVAAGGRGPR